MYYFADLFPGGHHGVDSAITLQGFISHGPIRFPSEWAALRADREAQKAFLKYIDEYKGPDDGSIARKRMDPPEWLQELRG